MNEDPMFGHSLKLVDGDIVLKKGELQLIQGKENLRQALNLRVLTPSSSDMLNTTYGLALKEALTQPRTVRQVKEYIQLCLIQTLSTDPRVHDIRDVIFIEGPPLSEQAQMDLDTMRHSRSWRVEVVIDTLDAQTTTLSLNIGV
jgi:hypothetical protein